jgi:hypothetical protein
MGHKIFASNEIDPFHCINSKFEDLGQPSKKLKRSLRWVWRKPQHCRLRWAALTPLSQIADERDRSSLIFFLFWPPIYDYATECNMQRIYATVDTRRKISRQGARMVESSFLAGMYNRQTVFSFFAVL